MDRSFVRSSRMDRVLDEREAIDGTLNGSRYDGYNCGRVNTCSG
jgi:hypothetical protein